VDDIAKALEDINNEIDALGLPQVLGVDNTTGTNDISIDNGQVLKGTSSGSYIDLDDGTNSAIQLNSLRSVYAQGGDFINNINTGASVVNDVGCSIVLFKNDFARYGEISVIGNSENDVLSFDIPNYPSIISSQNNIVRQNVNNTVVLGGKDIVSKTDDTAYVNQISFNLNSTFETILKHIPPTSDNLVEIQNGSGILSFLSDILKQKSGVIPIGSFTGNPLRATVTFATPFDDANYSISIIEVTNANKNINPKIDASPTAAGFTVSLGTINPNNIVDVRWVATKYGEN